MRLLALAWLVPVCAALHAEAPAAEGKPFEQRISTPAGELRVRELARNCRYRLTLGERTLLTTNCEDAADPNAEAPIPQVIGHAGKEIAPFADVLVLQQYMNGNACNGGPLWLLGIRRDGSTEASAQIDFCGGADPKVVFQSDQVQIQLPGGPINRGAGATKTEVWVYRAGVLRRVR